MRQEVREALQVFSKQYEIIQTQLSKAHVRLVGITGWFDKNCLERQHGPLILLYTVTNQPQYLGSRGLNAMIQQLSGKRISAFEFKKEGNLKPAISFQSLDKANVMEAIKKSLKPKESVEQTTSLKL